MHFTGFDSWSSSASGHVNNTDPIDDSKTLHNENEAQFIGDGNDTTYDTGAYDAYESSGPRCAYGTHDTYDSLSSSTAYKDYGTNDLYGAYNVFDKHEVHNAYESYDINDQSYSTYNKPDSFDTYVSHGSHETDLNESHYITEPQNCSESNDLHEFHNLLHDTIESDNLFAADDVYHQCSSYLSSYDCGRNNQDIQNNIQDRFVSCETVQDNTFIDLLGSIEEPLGESRVL